MNFIDRLQRDETFRREQFPIVERGAFFAHAGVCPLPRAAVDAMREFTERALYDAQESPWAMERVRETRRLAADLIGASPDEIALLGPTALGLNLVAHGLDWQPGDEVVSYFDDYPSNVYPWRALAVRGVKYVGLHPEHPGVLTWELIERALTPRTKLVALASCHFLTGYRIDITRIGRRLRERSILFSLDGIQTLGAFPTPVGFVDFMSADAHKWLLGPAGAGVFYVRRDVHDRLRPSLLGSMNVVSPDFVSQESIEYVAGAQRYESGCLNLPGIHGMWGALQMLREAGVEQIAARLLEIRRAILDAVRPLGYRLYVEDEQAHATAENFSCILSLSRPGTDMASLHERLTKHGVVSSLRRVRSGQVFVRLSPHFYITNADLAHVIDVLR
jgi:selenocysteine lyase/cysteine desulfurase